jgi:hypothetical protein
LTAQAPGYSAFHWEQTLAENEHRDVTIDLAFESRPRFFSRKVLRGLSIGAAAAGVVVIATAAGLTVDAQNKNTAELAKSPYSRTQETKDAIRSEAIAASVLFAAGAVLAVGAGTLSYFAWRREKSVSVTLLPTISPTAAGLVAGGQF